MKFVRTWLAVNLLLWGAGFAVEGDARNSEDAAGLPEPVAPPIQAGEMDGLLRSLVSGLKDAGVQVGQGTLQLMLVPFDGDLSSLEGDPSQGEILPPIPKPSQASPDDAILAPRRRSRPFLPNTMVDGPLSTALDMDYEMENLRKATEGEGKKRPGAVSGDLVSLMSRHHEEVARQEREERMAHTQNRPRPEVLGRGMVWQEPEIPAIAIAEAAEESDDLPAPSTEASEKPRGLLVAMFTREDDAPSVADEVQESKPRRMIFAFRRENEGDREQDEQIGSPTIEKKPSKKSARKVPKRSEPKWQFAAVESVRAPFHVFDVNPEDTILIELDGASIARIEDQGQEWAWIQLDSGLMGVVRNQHLREATADEVRHFQLMEMDGGAVHGFAIPGLDLDRLTSPIESSMGANQNESSPLIPDPADSPEEAPKEISTDRE